LGTPEIPTVPEQDLRTLAWNACGIVRSGAGLCEAIERLKAMPQERVEQPRRAQFELRNLHTVTSLIARCALAREESRGGHYRSDFPEKSIVFQRHSLIQQGSVDVTFG
jgi:L-aspartate oxidase